MSSYQKLGENLTVEKIVEIFTESLEIYNRRNDKDYFSGMQSVINCLLLGNGNFMEIRDRLSTYL